MDWMSEIKNSIFWLTLESATSPQPLKHPYTFGPICRLQHLAAITCHRERSITDMRQFCICCVIPNTASKCSGAYITGVPSVSELINLPEHSSKCWWASPEVWPPDTRRITPGGRTLTGWWAVKHSRNEHLEDYLGLRSHESQQEAIRIFPKIQNHRNM